MSPTISEIMHGIPDAMRADRAAGINAVIHFKFTGDQAGEWHAVIHEGTCTVAQGLPKSRPTLSVIADAADFIRVVVGEVDPQRAVMEGRIKLAGDLLVAPRLLQIFQLP